MDFEWDAKKAASNLEKHGVSFEEAATVLDDPLAFQRQDDIHDERAVVIGTSYRNRLLYTVVIEISDHTIRIISARLATKHEKKSYEEGWP